MLIGPTRCFMYESNISPILLAMWVNTFCIIKNFIKNWELNFYHARKLQPCLFNSWIKMRFVFQKIKWHTIPFHSNGLLNFLNLFLSHPWKQSQRILEWKVSPIEKICVYATSYDSRGIFVSKGIFIHLHNAIESINFHT